MEVGLYAGDATAEKTWLSLGIIPSSDEHSQIFQNHQFRSCYVLLPIAGSMNSMTLLKIHRKITSFGKYTHPSNSWRHLPISLDIHSMYHLVICYIAMENGPFIDGLPI